MLEVRSASTMELETLREALSRELRQREGRLKEAASAVREYNPPGTMCDVESGPMPAFGGATNGVSRGLTLDNVEDAFQYHPWHPGQTDRGNQVREALVAAAKVVLRNVPEGPDRSAALRKLREARMDANSAITHNGRF